VVPIVFVCVIIEQKHHLIRTGCPMQAKAMPPQVADTITTTRSDINLST